MHQDPRLDLFQVHFGPSEQTIINELVKHYPSGKFLNCYGIAEVLYQDEDGGPEHALSRVKVMVGNIRKKIEPHGWTITMYKYRLDKIGERK